MSSEPECCSYPLMFVLSVSQHWSGLCLCLVLTSPPLLCRGPGVWRWNPGVCLCVFGRCDVTITVGISYIFSCCRRVIKRAEHLSVKLKVFTSALPAVRLRPHRELSLKRHSIIGWSHTHTHLVIKACWKWLMLSFPNTRSSFIFINTLFKYYSSMWF